MTALLRGLTALAVALTLTGAGLTVTSAATAAPPSGYRMLDLAVSGAPSGDMAPGDRLVWPITVTLDAPNSGRLSLRVVASKPLTEDLGGLRFSLQSCDRPWVVADPSTATCPAGRGTVVADAPLASANPSTSIALGEIRPDQTRYFLGTLTLPADRPDALATAEGQVDLAFAAIEIAASGGDGGDGTDADGTDGTGTDGDGTDGDGTGADGTDDDGSTVADLIRGSGGTAGATGPDPASAIGGLSDWGIFSAFGFGKLAFVGPLLLALGLVLLVFIVILARRRRREEDDERVVIA